MVIKRGGFIIEAIIFLGTNKSGSSREALRAASKMGYYLILLTSDEKQITNKHEYDEVDIIQYCDLSNIEETKKVIDLYIDQGIEILAVMSFVDPYCAMAAELSAYYNKPTFTYKAMEKMQNKLESRKVLQDTDLAPKFEKITKLDTLDYGYVERLLPVVVKYVDSNGSKDVYLARTLDEYKKYTEKLFEKYPNGEVLVEEYVEGTQYIVEIVVANKCINIVGIIEQEIQFVNEHFIITGYSLVLNYPEKFYKKLEQAVSTIIEKHGLENGPCHLEMRYSKDKWKLIEANPRISGAGMNTFLNIGLGINLVQETIEFALDKNFCLSPYKQTHTFAQYIILDKSGTLRKISGRQAVLSSPGVKYVYIKPKKNTYLAPPTSLGGRYAFVIAIGETKEIARSNAKNAASNILFHLN